MLLGRHAIRFGIATNIVFNMKGMSSHHPNGMRFTALSETGNVVSQDIIYSIGGGFVVSEVEAARLAVSGGAPSVPYPFRSGAKLLEWGRRAGKSVADIVLGNEQTLRSADDVRAALLGLWHTMASFSVATSSIDSAGNFFNLPFSSSKAFSRLAPDISMSPYFSTTTCKTSRR